MTKTTSDTVKALLSGFRYEVPPTIEAVQAFAADHEALLAKLEADTTLIRILRAVYDQGPRNLPFYAECALNNLEYVVWKYLVLKSKQREAERVMRPADRKKQFRSIEDHSRRVRRDLANVLRSPELANDLAAHFESSELEGVYDPVGVEREFIKTCETLAKDLAKLEAAATEAWRVHKRRGPSRKPRRGCIYDLAGIYRDFTWVKPTSASESPFPEFVRAFFLLVDPDNETDVIDIIKDVRTEALESGGKSPFDD